jgi:adenine specific DNA methylase Mod
MKKNKDSNKPYNGLKSVIAGNETVQANTELLDILKTAVPQFFNAEGYFKSDKFEQELKKANIAEARDGYKLGFVGKDYARLQTGLISETMIVPDSQHNNKPENQNSGNVFITGDNLDALRHLQNAYRNKIKVIYIDPPYNTGQEFVYNDVFEFDDEKLKDVLGYSDDEIKRLKSIQGKSSHSAWLTFMYPRLKLAQKLLTDDGVIFVSIDDNEQANLKLWMDDVFGEGNFAGQIVWQTATDNNPTQIATEHEYVLCYVKNILEQGYWEIPSDKGKIIQEKYEELKKVHKTNIELIQKDLRRWIRQQINGDDLSGISHYSYVDEKSVFYPGNSANTKPGGYTYDIIHPKTKKVCAKPMYGYRWTFDTFKKAEQNGDVQWGKDEKIIPKIKKRLDSVMQKLKSYYYEDNRTTSGELKKLFNDKKVFDNPKSINFLKHIFQFVTSNDSIILDFFAGSGTTAHAVMQLNAVSNSNRKFILVQIDEPTKLESDYETIDEIARERIRLAAKEIKKESSLLTKNPDLGFKHYRLVTPEVQTLDKIIAFDPEIPQQSNMLDDMVTAFDNETTGTTGEDVILQTWLIADGYPFDMQPKKRDCAGYNAFYIDDSLLYIIRQGWDAKNTESLLNQIGTNELNLNTIIVYGYSFSMESLRELELNVRQTLNKQIQIEKRY